MDFSILIRYFLLFYFSRVCQVIIILVTLTSSITKMIGKAKIKIFQHIGNKNLFLPNKYSFIIFNL